jgi:hypothetical protein
MVSVELRWESGVVCIDNVKGNCDWLDAMELLGDLGMKQC